MMWNQTNSLRFALPKGRMEAQLFRLLKDAGMSARYEVRAYRPELSPGNFETKVLKPQSIVKMLEIDSRDIGFTGADWVKELGGNIVELLDTGLDPVSVVVAAPIGITKADLIRKKNVLIASEFESLSKKWARDNNLDARFVRSYGATEVFPPEDADCVVDIAATGLTLKQNRLQVIDKVMESSTRLYASTQSWSNPKKRVVIEEFIRRLKSALDARD